MSVELSQLIQLIAGHRAVLGIGNVPYSVATALDCRPGIVNLTTEGVRHVLEHHPDITPNDLMLLTFAVERGQYYRDPKRRDGLSVVYNSCVTGKPYILALKRVGPGELWVSTYHHTNPKKVRQRQSRWPMLCNHR